MHRDGCISAGCTNCERTSHAGNHPHRKSHAAHSRTRLREKQCVLIYTSRDRARHERRAGRRGKGEKGKVYFRRAINLGLTGRERPAMEIDAGVVIRYGSRRRAVLRFATCPTTRFVIVCPSKQRGGFSRSRVCNGRRTKRRLFPRSYERNCYVYAGCLASPSLLYHFVMKYSLIGA